MVKENSCKINTPDAVLEAKVCNCDSMAGMVMCHPHPLFAGTMDNKVVTTAVRSARDLGFNTLRFNFRGVGNSTGSHDNGQGEQNDVLAALHYAKEELGWQTIILCGFSFGAGMACLATCREPELVDQLILIAPPVHHFDAPSVLPDNVPVRVCMGDADEVVPFDEVADWVNSVQPSPQWQVFPEAGHFFHGRLTELKADLQTTLQPFLE